MSLKNRFNRFSRTVMALVLCLSMLSVYAVADDPSETKATTKATNTTSTKETTTSSSADDQALKDLQKKYDRIEKKISQNEKKLDRVESSKAAEESNYKKLNSEISDLNSQISIVGERISVLDNSISKITSNINKLDGDIEGLDKEINQINYDIVVTKNNINDRYEMLKKRLRAAYMTGNVSNLQILLSSKDFSTFLNNAEMVKRVADYDMKLIDGLEDDLEELGELNTRCNESKKELNSKISQLSSEKDSLSAKKSDAKSSEELLESKQAQVSAKRAESQKLINEMDKDSEEYKKIIADYLEELKRVEAEMDRIVLERGSSTNDKTEAKDNENDSGEEEVKSSGKYVSKPLNSMKWPVPYKNCYISVGYTYYDPFNTGQKTFHNAIDICVRGGSEGKDIVAAQNGKVIKTGYGHSLQGNYIILDHGGGVTTVYYHCQKLLVKEGQFVDKGTRIALIGHTGKVTGPHLHFGIKISDGKKVKTVNPLNYVSMP